MEGRECLCVCVCVCGGGGGWKVEGGGTREGVRGREEVSVRRHITESWIVYYSRTSKLRKPFI